VGSVFLVHFVAQSSSRFKDSPDEWASSNFQFHNWTLHAGDKLMGLFDLFSNDSAEKAADQRNQGLQQGYDALSSTFGQGRDALTTGANAAGNLYSGLGDYFKTNYAPGAGAYGDASGANGAAGYTRANANFQANPGYQFQMDQGLQALDRTHAAAGNLNSGNADADTLKYATGLANQSYTNYLSGLQPYLGLDATGQAAATAGQAGAATGLGTGLNQSYQGQGTAANANYTGQGASDAAATMNNSGLSKLAPVCSEHSCNGRHRQHHCRGRRKHSRRFCAIRSGKIVF
jgi:hypothetical protein